MTEQEYIKAQGEYASELQRFRDSARPDMMRLVKAGAHMNAVRKAWMAAKRVTHTIHP